MPPSVTTSPPSAAPMKWSQSKEPDEPFSLPSSPTIHARPPGSAISMPMHTGVPEGTSLQQQQQQTLKTSLSSLTASKPLVTFSENPKWTTSTGPWTSPRHPTPQPPPSLPNPDHRFPATAIPSNSFINSASRGSLDGNIAVLAAIPTVVGIALASAVYFLWRRARLNRWKKNFKVQPAHQAIGRRRDARNSDSTSLLREKQVTR